MYFIVPRVRNKQCITSETSTSSPRSEDNTVINLESAKVKTEGKRITVHPTVAHSEMT